MSGIENEDSAFVRSGKIIRSPPGIVTRSQSRVNTPTNSNKNPVTDEEVNKQAQRAIKKIAPQRSLSETNLENAHKAETRATKDAETQASEEAGKEDKTTQTKEKKIEAQEIETINTKMDQQKIQQNIVSMVKEFNGENGTNIANELTKFIDTADLVYESLQSAEEREAFTKLIKFRLNGDAYARISSRQIGDYNDFKKILRGMFLPTYSISELERKYMETRQKYGESISNFGYRLAEALNEYKDGYKLKYGLQDIDNTYNKHLDTNSVQTFKRGLNNIILRDKMATSKAENINEIMNEASETEKMLAATVDTTSIHPHYSPPNQQPPFNQQPNVKSPLIICNYCNLPNHTWDKCRRRLNNERFTQQSNQYNANQNPNNNNRQSQNNYFSQPTYQNPRRQNFYTPPQNPIPRNQYNQNQPQLQPFTQHRTNNDANTSNTHFQQRNQNFVPQRQFEDHRNRPPKYCSHCKTTVGHTFNECRNKHRDAYIGNRFNRFQPPTNNDELEEKFRNMKINLITAQQQTENLQIQNEITQQPGNERGLAEM